VVNVSSLEAGDESARGALTAATELEVPREALHRPMPTPVARNRTAAAAAPSQILDPNRRTGDSRIADPPP
jgi:hypothetical protein